MIVVADTSPLNYLILIGHIDLLSALYECVLIPPAVRQEMLHPEAPAAVRAWMAQPPDWVRVQAPTQIVPDLPQQLGPGEEDAICLACEINPSFLVVDETLGRTAARAQGIQVIGLLGVLKQASQEGLVNLELALDLLQKTSFHASPALIRPIQRR